MVFYIDTTKYDVYLFPNWKEMAGQKYGMYTSNYLHTIKKEEES
jgi:hypothetical protein